MAARTRSSAPRSELLDPAVRPRRHGPRSIEADVAADSPEPGDMVGGAEAGAARNATAEKVDDAVADAARDSTSEEARDAAAGAARDARGERVDDADRDAAGSEVDDAVADAALDAEGEDVDDAVADPGCDATADAARGATIEVVDDVSADAAAAVLLHARPAIRTALLAWYDAHRRALPWRAAPGTRPDPYAVFVSEVMLQQTRVETVLGRFGPWMARFPDWAALAGASQQEVLAQWAGLGYYRRARNLHAAARHVVAHALPRDAAGLRKLPGVGPYMAAAVASIAFGQPVAAVDGNVVRVISRLEDIDARVDRAAGRRAVESVAAALVDPARPGDWNQAIMDLGATVCTPRPRCDACPVAAHCRSRAAGTQRQRPVAGAKAAPRREAMHFAFVRQAGRVLVVPRPNGGLLAGTWMLPGGPAEVALAALVKQQTGLDVALGPESAAARHVFTHRVWDMRVHAADVLAAQSRHAFGVPSGDAAGAQPGPPAAAQPGRMVAIRTASGQAFGGHLEAGPPGRPDAAPVANGAATLRPTAARWVDPDAPDVALSTCCRKAIQAAATLRTARPSPFV